MHNLGYSGYVGGFTPSLFGTPYHVQSLTGIILPRYYLGEQKLGQVNIYPFLGGDFGFEYVGNPPPGEKQFHLDRSFVLGAAINGFAKPLIDYLSIDFNTLNNDISVGAKFKPITGSLKGFNLGLTPQAKVYSLNIKGGDRKEVLQIGLQGNLVKNSRMISFESGFVRLPSGHFIKGGDVTVPIGKNILTAGIRTPPANLGISALDHTNPGKAFVQYQRSGSSWQFSVNQTAGGGVAGGVTYNFGKGKKPNVGDAGHTPSVASPA